MSSELALVRHIASQHDQKYGLRERKRRPFLLSLLRNGVTAASILSIPDDVWGMSGLTGKVIESRVRVES